MPVLDIPYLNLPSRSEPFHPRRRSRGPASLAPRGAYRLNVNAVIVDGRVAQLVIPPLAPTTLTLTDGLNDTPRAPDGLGSTAV